MYVTDDFLLYTWFSGIWLYFLQLILYFWKLKNKINIIKKKIIKLYSLIHAVIMQICNSIAELVIPTGISTNKAKVEVETQSLETKISKC